MLLGNYGNSKMYRVECSCGHPDDSITLDVEAGEDGVSVLLYSTTKSNWYTDSFIKRIANKILLTWKLWTSGYLQYEAVTTLNKQQALNFAVTIEKAIVDVESFRQERNPKNM